MITNIIFFLLNSISLSKAKNYREVDKFAYIGDIPIDTVKNYKTRRNSWGDVIASFKTILRHVPESSTNSRVYLSGLDVYSQNKPTLESILSAKYISNFSNHFQIELWTVGVAVFDHREEYSSLIRYFSNGKASDTYRGSVGLNLKWNITDWVNLSLTTDNTHREQIFPIRHYDESITESFVSFIKHPEGTNRDFLIFNSIPSLSLNFLFEGNWARIAPSFNSAIFVNTLTIDSRFNYEILKGLSLRALVKPSYTNFLKFHIFSLQTIFEINYNLLDVFHFNFPIYCDFIDARASEGALDSLSEFIGQENTSILLSSIKSGLEGALGDDLTTVLSNKLQEAAGIRLFGIPDDLIEEILGKINESPGDTLKEILGDDIDKISNEVIKEIFGVDIENLLDTRVTDILENKISDILNSPLYLVGVRAGINPNIVVDWEFVNNFYLTGKIAINYDFFAFFDADILRRSSVLTTPIFRYSIALRIDTR